MSSGAMYASFDLDAGDDLDIFGGGHFTFRFSKCGGIGGGGIALGGGTAPSGVPRPMGATDGGMGGSSPGLNVYGAARPPCGGVSGRWGGSGGMGMGIPMVGIDMGTGIGGSSPGLKTYGAWPTWGGGVRLRLAPPEYFGGVG